MQLYNYTTAKQLEGIFCVYIQHATYTVALLWIIEQAITTQEFMSHISHLLYFMHRPGWVLTIIIGPLKVTRKLWL